MLDVSRGFGEEPDILLSFDRCMYYHLLGGYPIMPSRTLERIDLQPGSGKLSRGQEDPQLRERRS